MQTLFPNDLDDYKPDLGTSMLEGLHSRPWDQICACLRRMLSSETYEQWISPLKLIQETAHEIVIGIQDLHVHQTINDSFLDKIEFAKEQLGIEVLIRFEIIGKDGAFPSSPPVANRITLSESLEDQESYKLDNLEDPNTDEANKGAEHGYGNDVSQSAFSRALTNHSAMNREYIFETFVKGPSNQFAHASCLAVADNPGRTYNPLFIYGSTGLGKTHLLHAVGNRVLQNKPNAVITYITSERFMNEMIYCLRFNKMWEFRRKYRNCDVLLVDDIQFISKKERTQEEFFHTFNALYEAKGQIVVTSDIFPQDIPDIEDRLRNRFQWGLIADIQPPDVEHRIAILMNKADKQGIRITDDVALYIATHAKGNVRVLEGALRRVAAFAKLQGRPMNLDLASEILQNVIGEPPKRLTIDTIMQTVSDHYKLKVADLRSKKRQRTYSLPRQIAMYLSRERTKASFPEIGDKFGGKDHTTVMHAHKKIKEELGKDIDLRNIIETLERRLDQQF